MITLSYTRVVIDMVSSTLLSRSKSSVTAVAIFLYDTHYTHYTYYTHYSPGSKSSVTAVRFF